MELNIGSFAADDLVKCYRPPRLSEVYPGNHVMLASGGPCMIVSKMVGSTVTCMYETHGIINVLDFDIAMLTCYGAK